MLSEIKYPKFFADTSVTSEIESMMALGIISGITTNPLMVAKEAGNNEPASYYKKIVEKFPKLPISIQLFDKPEEELLKDAREFALIGPNIVVKVPMFGDGRGLKILPKLIAEEINRTRTLIEQLDSNTEIITGSIRNPSDVLDAVIAGTHIVTITPPIFENMIKHSKSDEFVNQSQKAWEELLASQKS